MPAGPPGKRDRYRKLVAERRACRACRGLTPPSDVCGGQLDSDEISPYSRWQGNLNADLVIVGQDFADVDTFIAVGGWPGSAVRTNVNLVRLLGIAGVDVRLPEPGRSDDIIFATNAVLCLKSGGMSAPVRSEHVRRCATTFLRRTLDLIDPRAIACLGLVPTRAVLWAYDRDPPKRISEAEVIDLPSGSRLFPMRHPSRMRREDPQKWKRLGAFLRSSGRPAV